jgi:hypothetical protein
VPWLNQLTSREQKEQKEQKRKKPKSSKKDGHIPDNPEGL